MRRISIIAILTLSLIFSLFADTDTPLNVLTTNQEITAYKHMPTATDPEENPIFPSDPTTISFTILDPASGNEISSGNEKKLSSSLTDSNYAQNKSFDNAFSWRMTGNKFSGNIVISFKFGPLCSEELSPTGAMTVQDGTTVIPYTVTLASNPTTVEGISGTIPSNVQITYSNRNNYQYYTESVPGFIFSTTYYFFCADNLSYANNGAFITTSPKTVTLTCDLYTYSFVERRNRDTDKKSNFTTCHNWERSGYASLVLGLNNDGYSWTDTSGVQAVTYKLPSGQTSYKANVVVTISVN